MIRYIKDIGENREREAFRTETLNILRSMEMACGLIEIDEAPFNHDPSEDWEWMISLSETFISHRSLPRTCELSGSSELKQDSRIYSRSLLIQYSPQTII